MKKPQEVEFYFKKYYLSLCYFALEIVGDTETSEDVVQHVFTRIISTGVKFDSENHFRSYIYNAVRNASLTALSAARRSSHVGLEESADMSSDSYDSDCGIIRAEMIRMIRESIDTLPPRYRTVFIMAYVEGLKNEEIAERLGISLNTVKVIRQRAKNRMRELLKDIYPMMFLLLKYIDPAA